MSSVKDGTRRLIFGEGTKVFVQPGDESQPSFYKLGDSDPQVCLATDFSKHNVNSDRRVFSETEAVLMDNLYSQVAVLPKELEEECDEGSGGSGPCEDKLEQDPMVNLMSMTVLGLRLLFLKTIVFNVLMTFRLWISQCEYETITTNPAHQHPLHRVYYIFHRFLPVSSFSVGTNSTRPPCL